MAEQSVDMRKLLDSLEQGYTTDRQTMKDNGTLDKAVKEANAGRTEVAEPEQNNHNSDN